MEFALSTPQVIAAAVLAAAVSVLVAWFDRRIAHRNPDRVTVRLLGSAVAAEPGDVILIGLNTPMTEEEVAQVRADFKALTDKGIKIGLVDNASSIAVARGRRDG